MLRRTLKLITTNYYYNFEISYFAYLPSHADEILGRLLLNDYLMKGGCET